MSDTARVAVVMGSKSDLPVMEGAVETLEELGVPFTLRVMSAHRSPEETARFAREAEADGLGVIIAAAGGAAHLAGTIAAHTVLPVIGVPVPTSRMGGMDSLFSTIQMPGGVPVACVGLGKSGATNAAVLAAQILAEADSELREVLRRYKDGQSERVRSHDASVAEWLEARRKP